ncbi:hypothetical protein BCR22_07430 [Enterococcus plantarum]|uniref:BppU family phage baseplate upper protein n=1 Tax=Enterococcus plantarum TaxID=1077675 RepID=UPI00084D7960|nr:BppU family phage baseplate upper protein [Enterococcus plantarum]OEG09418.1 hypothetical protein BCR22_07430 [Enterococcus plantarum]
MGSNYLKQEFVTPDAQITLGAHKRQNLESVIYSYDENISKLIIPVFVPDGKELDFENVETIKVLLTVEQDGEIKKIQDTATKEKSHRKQISYIITNRLKGYQGKVIMNVYLDLNNGQRVDLAEYGFTMVRSAIDKAVPEIERFYFKSLDDVIVELQIKADAEFDKIKTELESAKQKIGVLEKQITKQDIVKNSDLNKYQNTIAATAQLQKITADNGESYLKVSDTEKILDRVISTGAGFRNGEATGKTSDSPTGSNVRLIINMVVTTAGSVIAQDTSGNVYSRIISGSVWRGDWQQLVSKSSFDELASRVTALEGKVK